MKIFLQPHIQELKDKVLEIARIENIISADCYKLSVEISAKTHKTISQTTIKRVYGFAHARYAPSTFTLNALSQYCGYEGWSDFIQQMEAKQEKAKEHVAWNEIAQAAHNITRFTIQTNKHKSGLSYLYTIERQSINDHIDRFLKTGSTGCIISAPSGMGKTIGITHWVDKQMTANHSANNNHIILHVNSSSLFFAAGFGFHSNKWLTHLLNFPQQQHFEDFIEEYRKSAPGNFYLIIDDFNNNLINNRLFDIVFRQLIDMVAYLSNYPWMKVIITLRPSTWQKYGHLIENHLETNKLWYTNFSGARRVNAINLNPFSNQEIQQLVDKINDASREEVVYTRKYFPVIATPLHFQYYYQLKGNAIRTDQLNPADEYAIASVYLNKNILKGALAAEKQVMLTQFAKLLHFSEEEAFVNKKDAYDIIKENHSIYSELLHAGIVYEYQREQGTRAAYQIKFKSLVLAAYYIAQEAIEENNGNIDETLMTWMQKSDYPDHVKLAILKWLILFSLETGDLSIFNEIEKIDFIEPHQASLILFTCSNLDYVIHADPSIAAPLNDAFAASAFIDIALDHVLLEIEYHLALKKLQYYKLSYRQQILLHTSLAFFELLYLQDDEASKHIEILQSTPREHFAEFSLNPLVIIESIHHYYRHNSLKGDTLQEIKLFCTYPERNTNLTHKQLIYVLAYIALNLEGNPEMSITYLNAVNDYVLNLNQNITADFKACLHFALADRYAHAKKIEQAKQEQQLALKINSAHTLNRIQAGLLDMEMLRHENKDFLTHARQLILITKQYNLKYYEAFVRVYLIKTLNPDEYQHLIEEHRMAVSSLFGSSGYKLESFYNLFKATFISSSTVN